MRVGHWIAIFTIGYVGFSLFGRADAQFGSSGSMGVTPSVSGGGFCVGPPPPEVGPPRLIPGFDMNSIAPGRVVGFTPSEERIREALTQPAEFALVNVSLTKFARQVAEKYRLEVSIDVPGMRAENSETDILLTATVRASRLRVALREVLDRFELGFVIRNEMLIFTSKAVATSITPTRIYQVHDLVVVPNDPANYSDFQSLIELLTSSLAPETWREAGGTQGEVKGFNGAGVMALVITQSEELHEQIEDFFADLRVARLPAVYRLQQRRMRRADMTHPFIRN